MKRRILYCSLVLICLINTLSQGQVNYKVTFSENYSIKEVKLDDGNNYSRVMISDMQTIDSVGFPSLPVKYLKFIIPSDCDASGIEIRNTKMKKIKLDKLIEPVQYPIPIGMMYNNPDFVKPAPHIYNSDAVYPLKLSEIVEQGYFRGNHIVTVAVHPFQYYPKMNDLEFFSFIDFTIIYEINEVKKTTGKKVMKENNSFKKVLECLVENKEDIEKYSVQTLGESSETGTTVVESYEVSPQGVTTNSISVDCNYLIVTNESLAPEFNEFMAWKRRKGVDIDLVTIEDIYANYTGDNISGIFDNAGKLRQFLADAYNGGNGIENVLLGGENTIIPIRHGYNDNNTTDSNYIIPADLYFSEFNGDWEVDGDGRYGEPGDNVEFNPEIYVGRVMVKNANEVRNWTKKTLIYEMKPGNGDYTYLTKAFFTQADEMQAGNQATTIANATTWCSSTIYSELGGPNTTTTPTFPKGNNLINEFNNHYGFCSFMAHGGPTNVAVATPGYNQCLDIGKYKLTSNDNKPVWCEVSETGNGFDKMTNINHPTIYYSISCTTMPFDDFETPSNDRNMGETYTCIGDGGGPAYIGNTRYGWVSSSFALFQGFLSAITSNNLFNLGIAEATSKQNYGNRYLRFSHNLIGCPETEIWTDDPVLFNNVTITDGGYYVTVNTGGINNCQICVQSAKDNGAAYYQVQTPSGTSATFSYITSPYLVTITKHNYIPYTKNPDNIYVQNETISSDKYIYGKYFYAGSNVTPSIPQGPVYIQNGSSVVFDAENNVILQGNFEVQAGALFEIK